MNNIKLLKLLKKTIALSLIASSLVKTYLSLNDVLFIYPKLSLISNGDQVFVELIKKAIYISTSLFIDTLYGFALLVKPIARTKQVHIYLGIFLLLFSLLFFRLHAFDNIIKNWLFFPLS